MNSNFIRDIIRREWVEFPTNKIESTAVIWNNSRLSDHAFIEQFSYAISNTECFKALTFCKENTKLLLAERYGGQGIGSNGGGARCGTIGGYQLKGIGANCLVGADGDHVHSYGGLDAFSAICEIVFYLVLKKLMPVGVVDIEGLILTGLESGFDPIKNRPSWGVLLVREAAIRPAHFLPSPFFKPKSSVIRQLKTDTWRTRGVNRLTKNAFKSSNEYIEFIGVFLRNCANQFAFSRCARIMHSALSPSNISIDGRWLDVSLMSFLSGNKNYTLSNSFYDEYKFPLEYALELCHNYSKYNNLNLNPSVFSDYYNEQFSAYCMLHVGFVFALPASDIWKKIPDEWGSFSNLFCASICADHRVVRSRSVFDKHDPVNKIIFDFHIDALKICDAIKINYESGSKNSNTFFEVITCSFKIEGSLYRSFSQYVFTKLLISLKRSLFCSAFYLSSVEQRVAYFCEHSSPEQAGKFIKSYQDLVDWVFAAESGGNVIIFKSRTIEIIYSVELSNFVINRNNEVFTFAKISDFLIYTDAINSSELNYLDINFSYFLDKLRILTDFSF